MLLFGKPLSFFVLFWNNKIQILNDRYATKENACQAICHIHGSDVHGYTVKCGWGRDESTNTGNNVSNYGSGTNNQNYNNNQYDSVS